MCAVKTPKAARDTFNATDHIAHDEGGGHATYCNVKEEVDRYLATLIIGINRNGAAQSGGAPPHSKTLSRNA